MQHLPTIIAIVGPTAVGKTSLGLDVAEALGGEIVSADSRQVYRDLDIGTGKITHAEMRGIPHYCIDIADPEDEYAVTEYVQVAQAAIADIVSRGKVPIVVGGTGFYIDVLLGRRGVNNTKPDAKLRQRLSARFSEAVR